jgi:hypothetical protein
MIWAEDDDFTGWCCSHCRTVAALAFNRVAQETFDQHACLLNAERGAPAVSARQKHGFA